MATVVYFRENPNIQLEGVKGERKTYGIVGNLVEIQWMRSEM